MGLTLQSELTGDVVAIRCQGRIVSGNEIDTLQAELDRQRELRKKFVLQLAEVDYIDSAGMGALVRLFGVLCAKGGGVKLCQLSPIVLRALQVTNLLSLFSTYPTEREAIDAFARAVRSPNEVSLPSSTRILCIDPASDLLAYLNALLRRSNYEVSTTQYLREVMTLVACMKPHVVICGPGLAALPAGEALVEKLRQRERTLQIVHLTPDFSTIDAGQAGVDLVNRLQALLAT
jgi:anti-sigma B factor antagonist